MLFRSDWLSYRFPHWKTATGFDATRVVRRVAAVPVFVFCLLVALLSRASGRRWLIERVPPTSPLAMGLFRIALALSWTYAVTAIPEPRPAIRVESLVLIVPFALGLLPRLALLGLAWIWLPGATHDTAMPAKTLLLLAVVPWSDGFSVVRLVRRRLGWPVASGERRIYGLATWIPVAMMGMAYAAAAFAKVDEGGIGWISGGVIRYFFVIDAPNAPSALGRAVASSDVLSVLLAGAAVVTEASVIVGALYPRPMVVLAAGLGALALHTGFWVFQGVWWPAWWAMLPAFLPWSTIARAVQARLPPAARSHTDAAGAMTAGRRAEIPLAVAVVLAVAVLQQPLVSLARIEYRPLFSDFSMYSDSQWTSKQEFAAFMERERRPAYMAVRVSRDGADWASLAAQLREVDPENGVIAAARAVAAGAGVAIPIDRLRAIDVRYQERFGAPLFPLRITTAPWRFDWDIADFSPAEPWRAAGVIDLSAGP